MPVAAEPTAVRTAAGARTADEDCVAGRQSWHIAIIEPYVCIHCKERKNVCLLRAAYDGVTEKEANHLFEENESEYKEYLKPRAVVEDMISDFQLVDRTYLELADSLHPGRSILQISTQNEN